MTYVYRQMTPPRANRKHIGFDMESDPYQIIISMLDDKRIKQVLINLIDNAFKHTESRGGKVVIRCHERNYEDNSAIYIEVEDTGSGISQKDLPEVFKRFYQGEGAAEGGGLGLALCKEIIELHDGWIEIESEKDVGTLVRVVLPQAMNELSGNIKSAGSIHHEDDYTTKNGLRKI